jgi:hypothetical protein
MSDSLIKNIEKWHEFLRLSNVGGVRIFTATSVADRITDIAVSTLTRPADMPLSICGLYMDARGRQEDALESRESEKPFTIGTLITAVTTALATLRAAGAMSQLVE